MHCFVDPNSIDLVLCTNLAILTTDNECIGLRGCGRAGFSGTLPVERVLWEQSLDECAVLLLHAGGFAAVMH